MPRVFTKGASLVAAGGVLSPRAPGGFGEAALPGISPPACSRALISALVNGSCLERKRKNAAPARAASTASPPPIHAATGARRGFAATARGRVTATTLGTRDWPK